MNLFCLHVIHIRLSKSYQVHPRSQSAAIPWWSPEVGPWSRKTAWAVKPVQICANHTPNSTVLKSSLFENKSIWSATCHRHSTVKRVAEGPGALGVARLSESNHSYVLNCLNLPMQKGKTRRRVCDPSWLWLLCFRLDFYVWSDCRVTWHPSKASACWLHLLSLLAKSENVPVKQFQATQIIDKWCGWTPYSNEASLQSSRFLHKHDGTPNNHIKFRSMSLLPCVWSPLCVLRMTPKSIECWSVFIF